MAATRMPEALRGKNKGHTPWLLRRIWERVNQKNEHFMGVIVGREGSGKSYTALRIASELDPSFDESRIIFDVGDLLEDLRDGTHSAGDFYVLDEAGVQLGRRTWQDRAQILTNQALQLIRDHNLGLLFTLPRLSELDSQAQGRLQAFYEITEKEDEEYVRGKWKWMDPDRADDTGKIYKKYPRRLQNGKRKRINSLAFQPPGEDIVDPYEDLKSTFQTEFYDEVITKMRDGEDDGDGDDGPDLRELATEIANNGMGQYVVENKQTGEPYINRDLIRVNHDLSQNDARAIKSLLEQQFGTEQLEAYT